MHLRKVKRFSEDETRFIIAQIALALGHLHKENIIYRDLKPENILVKKDGNVILADFGLATKLEPGRLNDDFAGTPEYLAPEMISMQGHNHTLDWWTLGILTFEMIVSLPPFYNSN